MMLVCGVAWFIVYTPIELIDVFGVPNKLGGSGRGYNGFIYLWLSLIQINFEGKKTRSSAALSFKNHQINSLKMNNWLEIWWVFCSGNNL